MTAATIGFIVLYIPMAVLTSSLMFGISYFFRSTPLEGETNESLKSWWKEEAEMFWWGGTVWPVTIVIILIILLIYIPSKFLLAPFVYQNGLYVGKILKELVRKC